MKPLKGVTYTWQVEWADTEETTEVLANSQEQAERIALRKRYGADQGADSIPGCRVV